MLPRPWIATSWIYGRAAATRTTPFVFVSTYPLTSGARPSRSSRPAICGNGADGLAAKGLAPASVNRIIKILRAALNLAADQDERLNSRAWERGLVALPGCRKGE